jgi:hypothetical protein
MARLSSTKKKQVEASGLKGFVDAVLDIAKNPQIFRHWIKEKKAWGYFANQVPSKAKLTEGFEIKKKRKGSKKFIKV